MAHSKKIPTRRVLRFETLSEVLEDCRRLADSECCALGTWSLAQIVEHLAQGIDCFYDGFAFRGPWWIRHLAGPLIRRRLLRRGLRPGIRLPTTAGRLLPPDAPDVARGLTHLERSVERLERDPPLYPHAYLGRMTHAEAKQFTLRHAELHLSFIVPGRDAVSGHA